MTDSRRARKPLECHLQRFPLAMLIAQMAVGFHAQRAAVLMSEPARNRWNVHAGLNAACSEQVPQIVVGNAFHTGQFCRAVD